MSRTAPKTPKTAVPCSCNGAVPKPYSCNTGVVLTLRIEWGSETLEPPAHSADIATLHVLLSCPSCVSPLVSPSLPIRLLLMSCPFLVLPRHGHVVSFQFPLHVPVLLPIFRHLCPFISPSPSFISLRFPFISCSFPLHCLFSSASFALHFPLMSCHVRFVSPACPCISLHSLHRPFPLISPARPLHLPRFSLVPLHVPSFPHVSRAFPRHTPLSPFISLATKHVFFSQKEAKCHGSIAHPRGIGCSAKQSSIHHPPPHPLTPPLQHRFTMV